MVMVWLWYGYGMVMVICYAALKEVDGVEGEEIGGKRGVGGMATMSEWRSNKHFHQDHNH
jgi:hypothetical protein